MPETLRVIVGETLQFSTWQKLSTNKNLPNLAWKNLFDPQ